MSAKPGSWQTVKSRSEEKKKRNEGKKKQEVVTDRLGVKQDPFAAFDRAHAAAPKQKQHEEQHGSYKGSYAGLTDEAPPAQLQDPDSPRSEDSTTGEEAAANGSAGPAVASKAKKPKVKKPKVTVTTIAATVDIPGLQSILAELQLRYASNETSQLEMLSDTLLRTFREASADLGKLLATKGVHQAADFPVSELPHALHNALASFVASCNEAALQSVVVSLVKATSEALGDSKTAKGGQPPPARSQAGLLIMLAIILRTRPQVLVSCAPQLRAMGPALTSGPRIQQLLWTLQQAAAADRSVAVAVWMRLLLPQCLGVPDLPSVSGTGGKAKVGADSSSGSAASAPLDAATAGEVLGYLRGLLQDMGPAGGGLVTMGDGSQQAVVPGAALELISRMTLPNTGSPAATSSSGGKKSSGKGPSASVLEMLDALKDPLRVLAGSGAAATVPMQEWLPLALETASLSSAAPEAPDAIVQEAAASVLSCLANNDAAFSLWESKHKGLLKGSSRVLRVLSKQPSLLQPLLRRRNKAEQLGQLIAALPARHRSHLATGKGWQGACARVAEDSCKALGKRVKAGGRGRGGAAGGSGSALPALLGSTAALAGVVVTAAVYRREVGGILTHYAGKEVAQQLDSSVLAPLAEVLVQGATAAQPYLAQAQEAAEPYLLEVQRVAGPAVQQLREAAQPHVDALQVAAAPYVEQLQAQLAPAGEELAKVQQWLLQQLHEVWQQLEEVWQRAKQD